VVLAALEPDQIELALASLEALEQEQLRQKSGTKILW
jgi:hypothetical protein